MKLPISILSLPILISLLVSIYFYPQLPEAIITHWNFQGIPDSQSTKSFGLFLFPLLLSFVTALLLFLPNLDPLKANLKSFKNYFINFILLLDFTLIYFQSLLIAYNLGYKFDFFQMMIPAFSLLFFYAGILMQKSKRNWFIGIRTPWTLSNDQVWNKTHNLGAKTFKIASLVILIAIFFPSISFAIFFTSILIAAIIPAIYSFIIFKNE